jgi:hypothetical protein
MTVRCLADIGSACRGAEVCAVWMPLHTKEYCYQELATAQGRPHADLAALHRAECAATDALRSAAQAAGMAIVDPTPGLIAALREGRRCWPAGSDGHFDAGGHAEIAAALAAAFASLQPRH